MGTRVANERGFTLLEVMITCAIIAILATIVIPQFTSDTQRSKANVEISSMFAALAVGQEQYKVDNTVYLATANCPTAAPNGQLRDITNCVAAGGAWNLSPAANLNILLPTLTAYCSYVTTVGVGTGTTNPGGFTWTSPAQRWYYIIATCDMKGDGGTLSTYFTSSTDSTIQKLNEGE